MAPPLLTNDELLTPHDHFAALHGNSPHGTVLLWERASENRWHKLTQGDGHIPAMLASQVGQPDRFLSVNEFHGWRIVRLLKSLRACYVDIDGCVDPAYALDEALDTLRSNQMPPPSAVVFSGRGLHLYWLMEPVPAKALPVWQRIQDTLVATLAPLGADPAAKDCTRVLRLVGSTNSKSGAEVRGLVFDPEPFSLRHLADEVLGYRPEHQPTAKVRDLTTERAKRGERLRTGSIYDRWHLVYQDLATIARWYDIGGIPEGHRNSWLYLNAVALSWFANPASLRDELEKQARVWTPGLTLPEVRAAIKLPLERAQQAANDVRLEWRGDSIDPRLRFKRETLWQLMSPIVPSELAPQLRAIVSDETKAAHEREREAARDRVKEGRHQTRHSDSAARIKPWESMGVSRATYYRRSASGLLDPQATDTCPLDTLRGLYKRGELVSLGSQPQFSQTFNWRPA